MVEDSRSRRQPVWETFGEVARSARSQRFRAWFGAAHARSGPLVSTAGVTVPAGTDGYGTAVLPHGTVAGEVRRPAAAPVPPAAAIGGVIHRGRIVR